MPLPSRSCTRKQLHTYTRRHLHGALSFPAEQQVHLAETAVYVPVCRGLWERVGEGGYDQGNGSRLDLKKCVKAFCNFPWIFSVQSDQKGLFSWPFLFIIIIFIALLLHSVVNSACFPPNQAVLKVCNITLKWKQFQKVYRFI